MAASCVEMVISRLLKYTRRIITPLISGIVVTLIGMSLIKVGITACGGGAIAQADGTFGSLRHVGLAALVLVLIIFFNRSGNRYLRMSSIVIGLVIGYVAAWTMGMVDFSSIESYGGFNLPLPFRYGLDINLSSFIALGLIFMITAIEAYGDITILRPTRSFRVNRWKATSSSAALREVSWPTVSTRCWQECSTPFPTPSLRKTTV